MNDPLPGNLLMSVRNQTGYTVADDPQRHIAQRVTQGIINMSELYPVDTHRAWVHRPGARSEGTSITPTCPCHGHRRCTDEVGIDRQLVPGAGMMTTMADHKIGRQVNNCLIAPGDIITTDVAFPTDTVRGRVALVIGAGHEPDDGVLLLLISGGVFRFVRQGWRRADT